jgi:hypothetical protein
VFPVGHQRRAVAGGGEAVRSPPGNVKARAGRRSPH